MTNHAHIAPYIGGYFAFWGVWIGGLIWFASRRSNDGE